jgi:hypothetical protein
MAIGDQTGQIAQGVENAAIRGMRAKMVRLVEELGNGASHGCSPNNHKVVCSALVLILDVLLAILDAVMEKSKANAVWATLGSIVGGLIMGLLFKLVPGLSKATEAITQ